MVQIKLLNSCAKTEGKDQVTVDIFYASESKKLTDWDSFGAKTPQQEWETTWID